MLLDNTHGLLNLFEFKNNHFNSFFQAEYEFKNSNYGGKYSEIIFSLWILKNTAFSNLMRFLTCWQLLFIWKQTEW